MVRVRKPWKRKSDGAYYTQVNGKKVYLSKDKKTAEDKLRRILTTGKVPSNATVRDVLVAYWRWLKANRAPETVTTRKKVLRSFGRAVPGSFKAEALRPHHVQSWISKNPKIKSPTTAHTRISLIISVFSWAKRMRYIDENPLADMPKPSVVTRQEFVPVDLWQKVLSLATDEAFRDLLTMLLSTGCRLTEAMRFEALHFNGHSFVLPITESKGRKRSRVVFLSTEALAVVQRLVALRPEGKLFLNSKGRPWNRNSVRCRFRLLKRELKMPWLTATHMRHSFAHHRLSSGQDALTVAKLMGHVDTRMLATRYGHLDANQEFMVNAANQTGFPPPPNAPATPTA